MNSFKKNSYISNLLKSLNSIDISKCNQKELNFFRNKKILITGVSGIIGINLLFFFNKISKEKKINLKIDGTYKTNIFPFVLNYFKKNYNIKFYKFDLTKKKINKNKKYDLIFHCAGYAQPYKFLKYKDSTYKLNSSVIINFKENMHKKSKFIYLSSTEIYSGNNKLCNEIDTGNTSTNHPRSAYIDSKKFAESYIINFFKNFLIFRACLVYGIGAKLNDKRVLNQVILRSINQKKIDIFGGLKQLRSNLYILDAILMIIKATARYNNEIFNLNNDKYITLLTTFKLISKLSSKKLNFHKEKLLGSPKIIKISNKKILKYLKYKIKIDLKEGLIRTINWYKNLILAK